MPDRDLAASHLQRETERQNRIYQDAIARKKTQPRAEEARVEPRLAEAAGSQGAANRFAAPPASAPSGDAGNRSSDRFAGAFSGDADAPNAVEDPAQAWNQKLRHIPDIRSALIPLPEQTDATGWSKPFSLVKADMEPWLSFYRGYVQSRLFLDASSSLGGEGRSGPSVDFAVRALLELKQVDIKVILEPAVQINGQVEYAEVEEDVRACRSEAEARGLMKSVGDAHDVQLRKAVDKGRDMGSLLYDALMGEGHVNLIRAWEATHLRRPSVEELHLMLTTGRTTLPVPRKQRTKSIPEAHAERIDAAAVTAFGPAVQKKRVQPPVQELPPSPSPPSVSTASAPAARGRISWLEKRLETLSPQRRVLVPVILATGACAALVALGLAGVI